MVLTVLTFATLLTYHIILIRGKFNFRGLKFASKDRKARVRALANSLSNSEYDVVCLQELWCEDDYKYLKASCDNVFKYVHYFHRYGYI